MPPLRRALLPLLAILVAGLTAGFYVFASSVGTYAGSARGAADGVVVLTGGPDRITAGIELVANRRGRRLLVSGVDRRIGSPVELGRVTGGSAVVYRCCVDLGHEAMDTAGNAEEARQWAEKWGFRSLIVVTSAYHMPRSLAEFAIAMPHVTLLPHPVASRHVRLDAWWRHPRTTRLLVSEYFKYLTSVARLGVARVMNGFDAPSVAQRKTAVGLSSI